MKTHANEMTAPMEKMNKKMDSNANDGRSGSRFCGDDDNTPPGGY